MFNSNSRAVTGHVQALTAGTRAFSSKLDDFIKLSTQHISQLKSDSDQYQTKEAETLKGITARINEQLEKVQDAAKVIHSKDDVADIAISDIQNAVEETQEVVKSSFCRWSEDLRRHCEASYKQTETTSIATFTIVSEKTVIHAM